MIEAPNLKNVSEHRKENPNVLAAILLAPKFSKRGFDDIIQRIEYLNMRSGKTLHFYCAGYGAYQPDIADAEKLNVNVKYNPNRIPWTFSQIQFAKFVDDLETETKWTYSGNTEIIILENTDNFKNCIVLKIDEMIKDKIIDSANDIIEALIQYSRRENSIQKISLKEIDKITDDETIKGILSLLPKPFENLWNVWNKGKHYTLVDLE
ncbi:MAG: hypothetical protein ACI7YS_10965 [Flavobacterium sp.]